MYNFDWAASPGIPPTGRVDPIQQYGTYPKLDPTVRPVLPMERAGMPGGTTASRMATRYPRGGGYLSPDYGQAESYYDEVLAGKYDYQPERSGGPAYVYEGAPEAPDTDTWRYGSPSDIKRAKMGGGGGYGASAAKPPLQMPRFDFSQTLDLPDYEPPEEDPMEYKMLRREAMGRGERQVRNRAQEAIMSTKSIDNPQQRKQFIREILAGVGEGMEAVAAGAGREARQLAGQKRAEQLRTYEAQHKVKSQEAMAKYEQDFKIALLNYEAGVAEAQAGGVPGGGGTMVATRMGLGGTLKPMSGSQGYQDYMRRKHPGMVF